MKPISFFKFGEAYKGLILFEQDHPLQIFRDPFLNSPDKA